MEITFWIKIALEFTGMFGLTSEAQMFGKVGRQCMRQCTLEIWS